MRRGRSRRIRDFLRTLLLLAFVALVTAWLANRSTQVLEATPRILDGDSLRLSGTEIRLRGIDAPEFNQNCTKLPEGSSFPCGKRARDHLRQLVNGESVTCDGWETDKYNRLLAECYRGTMNINRRMVLDGWAVSFGDYEGEEAIASSKGAGLWSGDFQEPASWRRDSKQSHKSGWLGRLKFW